LKIYGHRGARGERPENTLDGFIHALSVGVAGIETDIAMTADFVPVLHHDPVLPDGRLIKTLNFAELPPDVPALEQALRVVPAREWLLEIKTFPHMPETSHPPAVMVEHVLAALAGRDPGCFRILAFDWSVLREVARHAPNLRRVCLTEPETVQAAALWWGDNFVGEAGNIPRAVAATGAHGWAAYHATVTAPEIAEAQALGLRVFSWTVNEPGDFARLAPLVDGIITDHPTRFLRP
jgi:glycerophosphoryl diester phosphodiesterase